LSIQIQNLTKIVGLQQPIQISYKIACCQL